MKRRFLTNGGGYFLRYPQCRGNRNGKYDESLYKWKICQ